MSKVFDHSLQYPFQATLSFKLESYPLNLRSAFGTSHSITTKRTNVLISLHIKFEGEDSEKLTGYGEVGLPPKKPLCYLADFNDIESYFVALNEFIAKEKENKDHFDYNPFSKAPDEYFAFYKNNQEPLFKVFNFLFHAIDTCPANDKEYSKAAKSGIEAALFDYLGKYSKKPIYEFIGIGKPEHASFFTAALNPQIEAIVESVQNTRNFTHFIKIKLDDNVERGFEILQTLYSHFGKDTSALWSVDANSAWNPQITLQYIDFLSKEPFKKLTYMIEQPFPVELVKKGHELPESELQKWRDVKQSADQHGLLIFADESVATSEDIPLLKPYVHGVNVKLEKAGGIREGLTTLHLARKEGLKTWIGSMVGSCLNSSTAAHLLALTDLGGDLDGGLLVDEPSQKFTHGIIWGLPSKADPKLIGVVTLDPKLYGIGVLPK